MGNVLPSAATIRALVEGAGGTITEAAEPTVFAGAWCPCGCGCGSFLASIKAAGRISFWIVSLAAAGNRVGELGDVPEANYATGSVAALLAWHAAALAAASAAGPRHTADEKVM